MEQVTYKIIRLPAFRAAGLKWEGSFTEVSNLKDVIHSMSERVTELDHAVDPNMQLGLSYHLRPDGFMHYSVYEVSQDQQLPEGMVELQVPEMTYLWTHHNKGEDIGQTYFKISNWLEESEYEPFKESDQIYYDSLPLKFEKYPRDRDLQDPHFEILIPIIKK
ncbi:GyrI-like domain-containing protein [Fredinandcohnia humi]